MSDYLYRLTLAMSNNLHNDTSHGFAVYSVRNARREVQAMCGRLHGCNARALLVRS